ncbi:MULTISPECIES: TetR/AcrR family transcriptional regulator [unclassified Spirosoma]|uniref:TetR/AcrR family transcriptional regulator n=1 Tax=unclassified Spirosoma TaxID=2621999 RepID=UPI000968BD74|nr:MULTISPECIES: TetR/AcrR family transcriptional regulator [unclassified Spirosoma]MBN8821972.1 TetR/AcrR family transcriptional regulator [Spirosoma sp.]OJW80385.1 MAG: TetR family transcriptional regulator [Spirosoma sp. 48-14]
MKNELSKAERTRQFIIETTAGIFNTKGYAGTSLSDLTEATGLTKGSIYGNFGSKEEVALACFDYNLSKINQVIQQRLAQETTFHRKLLVYAQIYHKYSGMPFPEGGCPILNTAIDADDTNNLLKDKAAKAIEAWKKRLVDLIRGGIDAGEFKPDIAPEQTALSMIALIEGGIMIAKATNNPSSLAKVLKTVEFLVDQLKS